MKKIIFLLLVATMLAGPTLGQSFEILATVKLGQNTTTNLKESLVKDSCQFTNFGDRTPATLMDQSGFTISSMQETCILGLTNPEKLGFTTDGEITQTQIVQTIIGQRVTIRGQDYIVEMCPAEAAPLLRLNYKKSRNKCYDWKTFIMNPITDIDGQSKIFRLLTGISTCNKKGYKILDVCPYQYGDKIKEPYFYNDSELIFRLRPIPNP